MVKQLHALVRKGVRSTRTSRKMEPGLLFALRAQCGRGRPRSQHLASTVFCEVFGQATDDPRLRYANALPMIKTQCQQHCPLTGLSRQIEFF